MEALIWGAIGVICLIAEALTLTWVVIYFGVGALAASLAAALGAPLGVQVGVFAIVAFSLLALTRRLVISRLQPAAPLASGVHGLTGRGAVVTIPISNIESTGQIRVGTEFWTARSIDEGAIEAGESVEVVEVRGVTARVRRRATDADTGT